jgi:hypothetical protein
MLIASYRLDEIKFGVIFKHHKAKSREQAVWIKMLTFLYKLTIHALEMSSYKILLR